MGVHFLTNFAGLTGGGGGGGGDVHYPTHAAILAVAVDRKQVNKPTS
jgi:hypothetical protein